MTDRNRMLDFAHTILVMRARALAEHEIARGRKLEQRQTTTFEFTLLAAAGPGELQLPQSEMLTTDGAVGVRLERHESAIRVHLQLKGYAKLSAFSGRDARLVAGNGSIDYAFRFDERGSAVCSLADDPAIVQGLAGLRIVIDINS